MTVNAFIPPQLLVIRATSKFGGRLVPLSHIRPLRSGELNTASGSSMSPISGKKKVIVQSRDSENGLN